MTETNVKPIRTYDYHYHCDNCRNPSLIKIPYGVIAITHCANCPRCGVSRQDLKDWTQKEYGGGVGIGVYGPGCSGPVKTNN